MKGTVLIHFSLDGFRKPEPGCCRFEGWMEGRVDEKFQTKKKCRDLCKSKKEPKCIAFELNRPNNADLTQTINPSEYQCYTYTGSGKNFHTGCGKRKDKLCFPRNNIGKYIILIHCILVEAGGSTLGNPSSGVGGPQTASMSPGWALLVLWTSASEGVIPKLEVTVMGGF